ncbi:uncharacterized protein LOC135463995 [Liolophura sinensis]|uniref:uncharacterized protein LOC135463995 n=1 Tax=Liolophura sinensis TaxID=3198878 RepID=UPI0031592FDD
MTTEGQGKYFEKGFWWILPEFSEAADNELGSTSHNSSSRNTLSGLVQNWADFVRCSTPPTRDDLHELVQLMKQMLTHQFPVNGQFPVSRFSVSGYGPLYCAFCRQNGETEMYYLSHKLKDRFGNVTCPVLRAYVCPLCRATGDVAHTIKYCPLGDKQASIPLAKMVHSGRNCSGKKRYRMHRYT